MVIEEVLDICVIGAGIALVSDLLVPIIYPPANTIDDCLVWRRYHGKQPSFSDLKKLYFFHLKNSFENRDISENPLFKNI